MTIRRLSLILLGCSIGMWVGVFGSFFADVWWFAFAVAAAASAIALVSIVAWAAQLTDDD